VLLYWHVVTASKLCNCTHPQPIAAAVTHLAHELLLLVLDKQRPHIEEGFAVPVGSRSGGISTEEVEEVAWTTQEAGAVLASPTFPARSGAACTRLPAASGCPACTHVAVISTGLSSRAPQLQDIVRVRLLHCQFKVIQHPLQHAHLCFDAILQRCAGAVWDLD
jgi:hypothetical protein